MSHCSTLKSNPLLYQHTNLKETKTPEDVSQWRPSLLLTSSVGPLITTFISYLWSGSCQLGWYCLEASVTPASAFVLESLGSTPGGHPWVFWSPQPTPLALTWMSSSDLLQRASEKFRIYHRTLQKKAKLPREVWMWAGPQNTLNKTASLTVDQCSSTCFSSSPLPHKEPFYLLPNHLSPRHFSICISGYTLWPFKRPTSHHNI